MNVEQAPGTSGLYRSFQELAILLDGIGGAMQRVRYAHQPNAFASLAVLAPCAAVPAVASDAARSAQRITWVSVDYDGADDEQLLRVRLPRANPTLGARMTATLSRRWAGSRLAASIPSAVALSRTAALERELIGAALSLRHHLATRGWRVNSRTLCRRRVLDGVAMFRQLLAAQNRLCDALAEHNGWIAEQIFGLRMAVVSGTDWLRGQVEERLEALIALAAARPDLVHGGIWQVCPRCHVRTRVSCRFGPAGAEVDQIWCSKCTHLMPRAALDLAAVVESPAGPCPRFLLPVQLDDLMERLVAPEVEIAVHYPGSYPHLAAAREILRVLPAEPFARYREPPPDWCPTHFEMTRLADILLTDASPVQSTRSDVAATSRLLYRLCALVSWSVVPGPVARPLPDSVIGPTSEARR